MIHRTIDYATALKNIRDGINKINTMFIGTIVNADYSRNRYSIQPVLMYKGEDEIPITKAILVSCPMCFTKTKSFYIRAPYEVGDMVYVGCSKDSIDDAIVDGSVKESGLGSRNKFREVDGVILGGIMSDAEPVLATDYTDALLLQNRANGDLIAINKTTGIHIYSSESVTISTKTATIVATDGVNIDSPMVYTTGDIVASGTITGGVVNTSGGIDLAGHTHGGVETGGGSTGPAQ